MPYGSVILQPGIDVEKTPTLNVAGIASTSLVRFRDGLIQKYGGWTSFLGTAVAGVPRDLHAWQDLNSNKYLTVGTTDELAIVANGVLTNITPATFTSNFSCMFTTFNGSALVQVSDPNLTGVTLYGETIVTFNTPVVVGNKTLAGSFPIYGYNSIGNYLINSGGTGGFPATSTGVVPEFFTVPGSPIVTVRLTNIGNVVGFGSNVTFPLPTTGGGVTIAGTYPVFQILNANNVSIAASNNASATTSFFMNNGSAQLVYQLAYDLTDPNYQVGTPVSATDWTTDNWGDIVVACPSGGGIFHWQPNTQFINAWPIIPATANGLPTGGTAPTLNAGIFVSTTQQILVAYGSTVTGALGNYRDPLLVAWSDAGDFTDWTPSAINEAGNFVIPTGTECRGGLATPNQNLIWTDIECWSMTYIGLPFIYSFNKIGAGAGLISSHAGQQLGGNVYWMGPSNFYSMTSAGLAVMPCPVWDFVFQNLNPNYTKNVRAMTNTPFNEAGWLFPSNASVNGECDCYVKVNLAEPGNPWDCGPSNALQRSAWTDQSILGTPVSADENGNIWQQEQGNNAGAAAMTSGFTTGYFYIAEGEDYSFVDQILPDFIWGEYGAPQTATIQLTFNVVNYPGDTPVAYGPYAVTQATEFITVRFRGRQMSITVRSSDSGSFWRIGRIRYRFAKSGRR